MKKPDKKGTPDEQVLQIHHIIEAVEDKLLEFIDDKNLGEYLEKDLKNVLDLPANDAALIAVFSQVHLIHNAVHDIMEFGRLDKIEEATFRKMIRDHVPRVVRHMDMSDAERDKLNKALGRND